MSKITMTLFLFLLKISDKNFVVYELSKIEDYILVFCDTLVVKKIVIVVKKQVLSFCSNTLINCSLNLSGIPDNNCSK